MDDASRAIAADMDDHLTPRERKPLLRFVICGSVEDGKSTLIGRLLCDAKAVSDDRLSVPPEESKRLGAHGNALDFTLLADVSSAEREQRITTDAAYRFFSSERRKFVVADTPGHDQYTRNAVTGASTADAAILVIDVAKGLLTQTRRHSHIVSLLGIRHTLFAVNKMDLLGYSEERFRDLEADCRHFANGLGIPHVTCIPVCALNGDNLASLSPRMGWYGGPTVMDWLNNVEIDDERQQRLPFRLPVQSIDRSDPGLRVLSGTIASGTIHPGERVLAQPSGKQTRVSRIVADDGDLDEAAAKQSITLVLEDEIEVSRGDLIVAANGPAEIAAQFEATLVWMAERPMLRGRSYVMKMGAKAVNATIAPLKYRININTLEHVAAEKLELNDIGVCEIELDQPIPFDPHTAIRDTGCFTLIDRLTDETVGAGMLRFALRRAHNVRLQHIDIDKVAREALKRQKACVLWLTGLSGAGKSSIANDVERKLHALGYHTYILDGDNFRHGLSKDLGFSAADRVENIRRVAEVARLMVDAGLIVITAFISPFRTERQMARELLANGLFIEVFVDTPLAVAEQRDPKGLYRKARRGEIPNFTGIDSPYEPPLAPELHIQTIHVSVEDAANKVLGTLQRMEIIGKT
jgi:bifunctional enzyme CysN/CysC